MSVLGQDYNLFPGMMAARETVETNFQWNKGTFQAMSFGDVIDGAARDAGNSPTTILRGGLLLGKVTSTGKLKQWSATAVDGTENVYSILPYPMKMVDLDGNNIDRTMGTVVGGYIKAGQVVTAAGALDYQARQQMRFRYTFDDDLSAISGTYAWRRELAKTTAYPVVASDNGTLFTNTGATGSVTFTLPTLANGLSFGFLATADFAIVISSAAGNDIVTVNDAAASSLTFNTAGDIVGSYVKVFSNVAGTKWYVEKLSSNAMTIA